MDLDQFVEAGVEIDSKFAPELVFTIFYPKTSLHDGGILLRQGRVAAAGCVFPVSQRELSDRIHRVLHKTTAHPSSRRPALPLPATTLIRIHQTPRQRHQRLPHMPSALRSLQQTMHIRTLRMRPPPQQIIQPRPRPTFPTLRPLRLLPRQPRRIPQPQLHPRPQQYLHFLPADLPLQRLNHSPHTVPIRKIPPMPPPGNTRRLHPNRLGKRIPIHSRFMHQLIKEQRESRW